MSLFSDTCTAAVGTSTVIEWPDPTYERPVPVAKQEKLHTQSGGRLSEDENIPRYSARMSTNVSYQTQGQTVSLPEVSQQPQKNGGVSSGGGSRVATTEGEDYTYMQREDKVKGQQNSSSRVEDEDDEYMN